MNCEQFYFNNFKKEEIYTEINIPIFFKGSIGDTNDDHNNGNLDDFDVDLNTNLNIDLNIIYDREKFLKNVLGEQNFCGYDNKLLLLITEIIIKSKHLNKIIKEDESVELIRIIMYCASKFNNYEGNIYKTGNNYQTVIYNPLDYDIFISALEHADLKTLIPMLFNSDSDTILDVSSFIKHAQKNNDPEIIYFIKSILKNVEDAPLYLCIRDIDYSNMDYSYCGCKLKINYLYYFYHYIIHILNI